MANPVYLPAPLSGLQNLQSLSFMNNDGVDDGPYEAIDCYFPDNDGLQDISNLITSNISTLQRLVLPGDQIWTLPVRVFSSLTELDIIHSSELSGLDLVFHHAVYLQSLILRVEDDVNIFTVMKNNSSALPCLTSFKLVSALGCTEEHFQAVHVFIQGRPLLRRLDLGLYPIDWTTFTFILPTIADLEGLCVLGLTIPFLISTEECVDFCRHLPNKLEAMRLRVDLSDPMLDRGPLSAIVSNLSVGVSLQLLTIPL
jgi:hypothetical protein